MKAVVAAFNQEKALVEAFSVITNLRIDLIEALSIYTDGCSGVRDAVDPEHRVEDHQVAAAAPGRGQDQVRHEEQHQGGSLSL